MTAGRPAPLWKPRGAEPACNEEPPKLATRQPGASGPYRTRLVVLALASLLCSTVAQAQLVDKTKAPNAAGAGIAKSLPDEVGAGRGDDMTPNSSAFLIARDPFRAIRRGRQLFQRKFGLANGLGPNSGDGTGRIETNLAIGAGLADSCALCHGRPRGSAGFGGDVATRPDSRDAPHLFGLGLKEMLGDEITEDLRATRARAVIAARALGKAVIVPLASKGLRYGTITALPDGTVDASKVEGVDADLRVRPFFAHGGTASIREFVVGALQNEMGLQAVDPELWAASFGGRVVSPAGRVFDGSRDTIEGPPTADPAADLDGDGVTNEAPTALVDYLEFYLLNYFPPASGEQSEQTQAGRRLFGEAGCASCHVPDLPISRDRRVASVRTAYDPVHGIFNALYATATPLHGDVDDGSAFPHRKSPLGKPFLVEGIYTDFKRHDVGPAFYEREYDGQLRTQFLSTALWGVGSTGPYGHDGRSMTLQDVIMRHGGEAQGARANFARLPAGAQQAIVAFLHSLVLFPPDDTASNLDPGNIATPDFPQFGHGSVKLQVLFADPTDPE
jgi:mono/diheme cytochrome c family protein